MHCKIHCDFAYSWLLLSRHAHLLGFIRISSVPTEPTCGLLIPHLYRVDISCILSKRRTRAIYGLKFRIALLFWLPTMTKESILFCYLTHVGGQKRWIHNFLKIVTHFRTNILTGIRTPTRIRRSVPLTLHHLYTQAWSQLSKRPVDYMFVFETIFFFSL